MDKITNKEISFLFEQNADYLYNYAITRVNDIILAEDLVQETFLSAIKSYKTFQAKSKASTWLIAILKNKIIDYYRKKVRDFRTESVDSIKTTEDIFDERGHWNKHRKPKDWNLNLNHSIEQEEFYKILHDCLNKLKEIQRIVFVMKHLDDEATETICKELMITASNYWVLMHRAKMQLRTCIESNWINK